MSWKFNPGRFLITRHAQIALHPDDVRTALGRHLAGDWGDLDAHDRQENERSVAQGGRLFSSYRDRRKTRFWIITEADRSATTVLLPEDY